MFYHTWFLGRDQGMEMGEGGASLHSCLPLPSLGCVTEPLRLCFVLFFVVRFLGRWAFG